ncbi:MAG: MBL fold metallo-hydrolase [Acidimicrobiia bacterium]|nr:MBL fold metallo-hydrolase [Acidimicrobiia bacterium]
MHREHAGGDGRLLVRSLVAGPLENNVYLAGCRTTGRVVLIDPAADAPRLAEAATGLVVEAVLLTHGHHDHRGAALEMSRRCGAPLRLHPGDAVLAELPEALPLADGEQIRCGRVTFEVRHTPGHTPGSVCFLAEGTLFSGDTLFPGGPGATDGPEAFRRVMDSLRRRLFTLPDTTLVLPGHGPATTIGAERPSLDDWERRGW